jgi:hypothetical protein
MSACGEDLTGILNTRYGKTLRTQISRSDADTPALKLVKTLGRVFELTPCSTKLQWLAVVQSCGFKWSALVKEFTWKISSASWRNAQSQGSQGLLPLPYTRKPSTALNTMPSAPNPRPPLSSPSVESMEVEPHPSLPVPLQNSKEGCNSKLLPYLQTLFDLLSYPCPHTNKRTMPFSINELWKHYNIKTDKPCTISPSCFRKIWKKYFRKQYVKAQQRDRLCQLCKIGHKLDKICENFTEILESEQKKIALKKNIVLRHKMIDGETKDQYRSLLENLKVGEGILTMDFKENITLGRGPRELGQS